MAEIRSLNIDPEGITVNLKMSEEEYSLIGSPKREVLLLPADSGVFKEELTTGKLGNGNRIMLPNKVMERYGVEKLHKKVPASIFRVNGGVFLVIKLEEHRPGVPVFGEG